MIRIADPTTALRRRLAIAVLALLVAGLWAATSSRAASATVAMQDFSFQPAEVTVRVGDAVTWTNRDAEPHAVQGGPFNSPDIPPGESYSFTFDSPGDVSYFCRIHTYMTGVVHVVTDEPTTTTSAPSSTTTSTTTTSTTTSTTTTISTTTSSTTPDGSTTSTTSPDGSTTTSTSTTTTAPPSSGGPAFQDVPDDPSATHPPGSPGASRPPPSSASTTTTTTTTTAPPGEPPPEQGVPNDPTGTKPPSQLAVQRIAAVEAGEGDPERSLGDGTELAPYTEDGGVKVFRLTMAPTTVETEPGVTKQAYAFNGVVPGPVLRVNEGDKVRIIVDNELPFGTGVHWHGMILPNDQDGVPGITQRDIEPGQRYIYDWTAIAPGTHWYHTHSSGRHIGKGLYGALEVIPASGDLPSDRDYRIMIGDTDLGFVLNGKSFPATVPLAAMVGERVRIRVINAGDQVHSMHLHGVPFDVVAQDGNPLPSPVRMDTVTVSPAQTYDLVAEPVNPGKWLFHCHNFAHSHKSMDEHPPGDSGMTGMVTILDVAPRGSGLPPVGPLDLPLAATPAASGDDASSFPPAVISWMRPGDAPLIAVLVASFLAVLPGAGRRRRIALPTPPTRKDQR
jgi:plastocyanin